MKTIAILLAGGSGLRAGGQFPKQYRLIEGKPVWVRALEALRAGADIAFPAGAFEAVAVVNPDYAGLFAEQADAFLYGLSTHRACADLNLKTASSGETRAESVRNGLETAVASFGDTAGTVVMVHDAARPLITPGAVARGLRIARHGVGVVPAVPMTDSLRQIGNDGESRAVSRENYVAVQTPQIFMLDDIVGAYRACGDLNGFTDDASVAEHHGMSVRLYEGEHSNIKVTLPEDFAVAHAILEMRGQK